MTDATFDDDHPPPLPGEESLSRDNPLDLFYSVLFHPRRTFLQVAEEGATSNDYLWAVVIVLLVSAAVPVVDVISRGGDLTHLFLRVPLNVLGGVFMWAGMAGLLSLLAVAFTGESRSRILLVLTAFATLPWLLVGPAVLLKVGLGTPGTVLSSLLVMGIWTWTSLLFAHAVSITYRMPFERVLILLAMPFVMTLVCLLWLGGFITHILQLSPLK